MPVTAIIAQLRTIDLERSIHFYTETLGLKLSMRYGDFYAGIEAGEQTFHLKLAATPDPSIRSVADGDHFHLYLVTDDLAAMADRLQRAGVATVHAAEDQPWGMREMAIRDDSGHTVYLGQRITASASP